MSARSSILRVIAEASPILSIALLLILPVLFPNRTTPDVEATSRRDEIALHMNGLPYTIGPWMGVDVDVPPAAAAMLHPNAILSRRYTRLPGGPSLHLVIIHCSDARDMLGHYPPVCYPAAGWSPRDGGDAITLTVADAAVRARVYEFSRRIDVGREIGVRIVSFFVLPDGSIAADMDALRAQSERLAFAARGAAQVQVVAAADEPIDVVVRAAEDLLSAFDDLFNSMGVGGEKHE